MKKVIAIFLVIAMAASLIPVTTFSSAPIRVRVDGAYVDFDDQQPISRQGRILVPVRGVFEVMGFDVEWIPETATAELTREGLIITIRRGDTAIVVNGQRVYPDVPPQIVNGRFMVPLRAISEASGADAQWDGRNQTAIITTDGSHLPVGAVTYHEDGNVRVIVSDVILTPKAASFRMLVQGIDGDVRFSESTTFRNNPDVNDFEFTRIEVLNTNARTNTVQLYVRIVPRMGFVLPNPFFISSFYITDSSAGNAPMEEWVFISNIELRDEANRSIIVMTSEHIDVPIRSEPGILLESMILSPFGMHMTIGGEGTSGGIHVGIRVSVETPEDTFLLRRPSNFHGPPDVIVAFWASDNYLELSRATAIIIDGERIPIPSSARTQTASPQVQYTTPPPQERFAPSISVEVLESQVYHSMGWVSISIRDLSGRSRFTPRMRVIMIGETFTIGGTADVHYIDAESNTAYLTLQFSNESIEAITQPFVLYWLSVVFDYEASIYDYEEAIVFNVEMQLDMSRNASIILESIDVPEFVHFTGELSFPGLHIERLVVTPMGVQIAYDINDRRPHLLREVFFETFDDRIYLWGGGGSGTQESGVMNIYFFTGFLVDLDEVIAVVINGHRIPLR
ncbi:MAG: copper amine oxidase N-terminal domain-containing protein [Defluviitaleaceae bacterium]|nr:copper amine oxidase N-terminal domain-containing protein [Defluviitaleaceae bacterium]